ncbi:MAG: tyrosine-type recombinase/integrase [Gammaproteobacteria bacterium AqS3]|nr:tyrosine-type recombinase/integrase [Gammaproteobacteria bacterium AqS3]
MSAHTVSAYRSDLELIGNRLIDRGIESWLQADGPALQSALNSTRHTGSSVATLRRRRSALRALYRYLHEGGRCDSDPTDYLELPRLPRRLPRGVEIDAVMRLMQPLHPDDAREIRNLAMFELMYSSGLRLSELTGLDINDVRPDGVRVLGKGRIEREVPIGDCALKAVRKWLAVRTADAGEPALFTGARGRRINPRTVQQQLSRCAIERGLHHINPHALRHAFATHLLEASGNLRAVQEFLGHRSLSSTQIYTQVDFKHLTRVYDRAHPRSNGDAS